MYFVYLIRNKNTKHLYIGYTKDLKRRLIEHQNKNPKLIYYEAYENRQDAILRGYIKRKKVKTKRSIFKMAEREN